jgi:hypothetical protein
MALKQRNSSLARVESWRQRRTEQYLSWWSRKRSKGQFHYVLMTSLWMALALLLLVPLVEYIVNGDLMEKWTFRLVFSLLAGLLMSLVSWWGNEAKYKNARIDAKIKLTER